MNDLRHAAQRDYIGALAARNAVEDEIAPLRNKLIEAERNLSKAGDALREWFAMHFPSASVQLYDETLLTIAMHIDASTLEDDEPDDVA